MLILNHSNFKTLSKNIIDEVNNITGEKTISNSRMLEILSKSFGYKSYNSIIPKLERKEGFESFLFSSKNELIEYGYLNVKEIKTNYLNTLDRHAIKDMKKYLRIFIYHAFKTAYINAQAKAFIAISKKELGERDIEFNKKIIDEDILFLNLVTGFNFKYIWKNKNSDLIIYWEYKYEDKLPNNLGDYKKEKFFVYFEDGVNYSLGMIIAEGDDWIKIEFADDSTKIISKDDAQNKEYLKYIYFESSQKATRASKLINDITNKKSHKFFNRNFSSFIRAKYILDNYPKVSNFILDKIYGYNLEFI